MFSLSCTPPLPCDSLIAYNDRYRIPTGGSRTTSMTSFSLHVFCTEYPCIILQPGHPYRTGARDDTGAPESCVQSPSYPLYPRPSADGALAAIPDSPYASCPLAQSFSQAMVRSMARHTFFQRLSLASIWSPCDDGLTPSDPHWSKQIGRRCLEGEAQEG